MLTYYLLFIFVANAIDISPNSIIEFENGQEQNIKEVIKNEELMNKLKSK